MMKVLDNEKLMRSRIAEMDVEAVLLPDEYREWQALSESVKLQKLERLCSEPLADFSVVYKLYFRMKWLDVLAAVQAAHDMTLLEVGSGESDMIPKSMAAYSSDTTYMTANMNKKLTAGLIRKTSSLPVRIEVIEDDANNITSYLSPNSVDLIVLEHSANDILQAILAEKHGIDTIDNDWFAILPDMIKLINREYTDGTLDRELKQPFLSLINNCLTVLKPRGILVISHYMFQYDLDIGYNPELWENMLPLIRPWFNDLSEGKELFFEGFDPQWWMFWQKHNPSIDKQAGSIVM